MVYGHAEIQTRVVVICGPTCYQLDHRGALSDQDEILKETVHPQMNTF